MIDDDMPRLIIEGCRTCRNVAVAANGLSGREIIQAHCPWTKEHCDFGLVETTSYKLDTEELRAKNWSVVSL